MHGPARAMNGNASTLDVVNRVKAALQTARAAAPAGCPILYLLRSKFGQTAPIFC
jgi:hypothetical protein